MTVKEIGSEFWTIHTPSTRSQADNESYLLSGRTALRFILDDICKSRDLKKVLLPSYCCESMIQPFIDLSIKVQFYQVGIDYIDYSYDNDADVILLIDFFGYINHQNSDIARVEKKVGKTIIYDSTHKIDGNLQVLKYVDYSFCSYRKWFFCNYAQAIKHKGVFCNDVALKQNASYIKLRNKAAHAKADYILGAIDEKKEFLSDFFVAEQLLDNDYVGYAGESVAFDVHEIILKRKRNAEYLINELEKFPQVRLWRKNIQEEDVPMFVPIFVDANIRDDLRSVLIKESIYCPVHWPQSAYPDKFSELYDTELSLICDQRYDVADMERMLRVIRDYFDR